MVTKRNSPLSICKVGNIKNTSEQRQRENRWEKNSSAPLCFYLGCFWNLSFQMKQQISQRQNWNKIFESAEYSLSCCRQNCFFFRCFWICFGTMCIVAHGREHNSPFVFCICTQRNDEEISRRRKAGDWKECICTNKDECELTSWRSVKWALSMLWYFTFVSVIMQGDFVWQVTIDKRYIYIYSTLVMKEIFANKETHFVCLQWKNILHDISETNELHWGQYCSVKSRFAFVTNIQKHRICWNTCRDRNIHKCNCRNKSTNKNRAPAAKKLPFSRN